MRQGSAGVRCGSNSILLGGPTRRIVMSVGTLVVLRGRIGMGEVTLVIKQEFLTPLSSVGTINLFFRSGLD